MSVGDALYSQALALPPLEREQLAVRILTSLGLTDAEADRAWVAELDRRVERWERGETQDMDAREALDRIRQEVSRKPKP